MADWGALGQRPDVVYQDEAVILICARWQDVVGDLPVVDAVITDPPYSERTHAKQCHGRREERTSAGWVSARGLGYTHLDEESVSEFANSLARVNGGWWAVLTDSELSGAFKASLRSHGLTDFSPIPCVMKGMNVRLAGDGPSSWAVWLVVARPKRLHRWGTLPGAYVGMPFDAGQNTATATRKRSVVGGKPVWLMRAIVSDYSRTGDTILDPCCGGGTTGVAARLEGRRCILIEMDPKTAEIAAKRLHPLRGKLGSDGQTELFV